MKLYVHYEDVSTKWTKRLTVVPSTATLQKVLTVFRGLFVAKFQRDLALERINVQTEQNQNESTRRLVTKDKYDQTLQQLGISETNDDKAACALELVLTVAHGPLPPPLPSPKPKKVLSSVSPATTTRPPPLSNRKNKPGSSSSSSSSVSSLDVSLRGVLDLALNHLKARRHRAARDTYESLVLSVDATHPEALLGLGEVYFSIGKFDIAANKYFKLCWQVHYKEPKNKAYALMAFTSALKLAECHLHLRKFRGALATLDELQKFLRRHSKCRSFFSDCIDKERMEAQMDYLRACALYELKSPGEQETAISLLMHLLPDLQDPRVNLDALQLYARVAQDRGRKNEALSMLLRVLVGKSTDHSVRKQLVELLNGKNGMERLLYSVPTTTPSAAAAYAFTATILKDFGAVESSVRCFEHAQALAPANAAYALNYAHALEACNQYQAAYDSLVKFLTSNPTLRVLDSVSAADVVAALGDGDAWRCVSRSENQTAFARWSFQWQHEDKRANATVADGFAKVSHDGVLYKGKAQPLRSSSKNDLSDQELDLLACFFTITKILFITGRLHMVPRLVALLEPLRRGRQLHKTSIRNEQAYYLCISQLLCIEPRLQVPELETPTDRGDPVEALQQQPQQQQQQHTYVCGDSHSLTTAWRTIQVNGSSAQLRPALVTGLKHWHLRQESDFYPKVNFWNVLDALPKGSRVVFLFGEIDCREGILQAVELCKYESIQQGMEHTIGIFMDTVAQVVDKYQFEILIHPVVPVLNETRHLVIQYNQIFKAKVAKSKLCKWLDFFDDLLEEGSKPEKLRSGYALDGTHLHPSYLELLERELNKL